MIRPEIHPSAASMLTLVAALAAARGIEQCAQVKPLIKWPNDIVINGRKVCGILTEMSADPDCINYVVTGIGINVNMEQFPEESWLTAAGQSGCWIRQESTAAQLRGLTAWENCLWRQRIRQ